VRFAEREMLVSTVEGDEPKPACESLTAPDNVVVPVRAIAEAEIFSRLTVTEKDAASSAEAPQELGMGRLAACPCGVGMFGIGMLRC